MNRVIRSFLLLVACSVGWYGCNEGIVFPAVDKGFDYYPLEVGRYVEYRLDSIIFDDAPNGNVQDTFQRIIRETITGISLNTLGDTIYIIEQLSKSLNSNSWENSVNYSAWINDVEAIRKEGNQSFLKLHFPVQPAKNWNSLTYIDPFVDVLIGTESIEMYVNWDSHYQAINASEQIGEFSFTEEVLVVVHADEDNEVERRYVLEKYVRDIGLVYREMIILDSRCKRLGMLEPCIGQSWEVKGEKGFMLKQEIIGFN